MKTKEQIKDGLTASVFASDKPKALKAIEDSTEAQKQAQESTEAQAENITASVDKTYLKNRIEDCISQYEIENDLSINDINQLQYNHVLIYIYENVIKELKIDIRDIFALDILADILIEVSFKLNKSISLYSFSLFTGIPYTTIRNTIYNNSRCNIYYDKTYNKVIDNSAIGLYRMHHKESVIIEMPNNLFKQVCEKIRLTREHMLTDKVEQGSIPALALGKIEFAWIESQKEKMQVEVMQKYTLPQDILKEYSDNN